MSPTWTSKKQFLRCLVINKLCVLLTLWNRRLYSKFLKHNILIMSYINDRVLKPCIHKQPYFAILFLNMARRYSSSGNSHSMTYLFLLLCFSLLALKQKVFTHLNVPLWNSFLTRRRTREMWAFIDNLVQDRQNMDFHKQDW